MKNNLFTILIFLAGIQLVQAQSVNYTVNPSGYFVSVLALRNRGTWLHFYPFAKPPGSVLVIYSAGHVPTDRPDLCVASV